MKEHLKDCILDSNCDRASDAGINRAANNVLAYLDQLFEDCETLADFKALKKEVETEYARSL